MPHCWKSHVAAQILVLNRRFDSKTIGVMTGPALLVEKSKQTLHFFPNEIKLNFETVIDKSENVMQPPKDICCIYGVAFSNFVHIY